MLLIHQCGQKRVSTLFTQHCGDLGLSTVPSRHGNMVVAGLTTGTERNTIFRLFSGAPT